MTESIINFFKEIIDNEYIIAIIISMIPLIELRGSIPVAIAMGMNPFIALACTWAGSVLIAPIILLILQPILKLMKKSKVFRGLANAVESIFQGKASIVENKANNSTSLKSAERKKLLGVFTFVALPIPLTGVWTGSAVASFLGLGFWKSFLMVSLGNLVAGSIITLLSVFLAEYIDIILYVLFAIVLVALIFYIVKLVLHMKKDKEKIKNLEDETNKSNVVLDAKKDEIETEKTINTTVNSIANENIENKDTKNISENFDNFNNKKKI